MCIRQRQTKLARTARLVTSAGLLSFLPLGGDGVGGGGGGAESVGGGGRGRGVSLSARYPTSLRGTWRMGYIISLPTGSHHLTPNFSVPNKPLWFLWTLSTMFPAPTHSWEGKAAEVTSYIFNPHPPALNHTEVGKGARSPLHRLVIFPSNVCGARRRWY